MSTKMARLSNHCQELNTDGSVCGESKNFEIFNEIKQIYEDRLRRIDEDAGDAGIELKLRTLQSWVMDLGDQNTILIQTVEQLEREASERVALLREGLDRSARSALNFMNKLDEQAVGQKITPADENEEFLHTKIRNLQSDITNLLELIRRAREENSWDVTGLVFTEVTFDDVFDSLSPNYGQGNDISPESKEKELVIEDLKAEINNLNIRLKQNSQYENNQGSELLQMQEEIITLREDIALKDGQIQGFIKRIQDLRADILDESKEGITEYKNFNQGADKAVEQSFTDLDIHISKALRQRNALAREVQDLNKKLESRTTEMDKLSKTVNEMDQAAKDMREALTAEVADKHDRILSLRREIQLLEERCHQADMQTHFKDNIIKEMRKDLKLARSKLATNTSGESDTQQYMPSSLPSIQSNNQPDCHLTNILQQLYKRSSEIKEPSNAINRSPCPQEAETSEKLCTSHSAHQQVCTPEKLPRSNNEKSYCSRSCERVSQNSSQYTSSYLEDVSDMAEHLGAEETYYEVRRRNSPPSKEDENTDGNKPHSGGKGDSVSVSNISKKEMELKDTVEHLKNKLILQDNIIKEQEKTIKDLEMSLRRYENDFGDLCFKTKESEVELEDIKFKLMSQVTGKTNEGVVDYVYSPESEIEVWNDLIDQMKGLSVTIKARENEIYLKDSKLNDIQEKVRKSQNEIEILKGKCAIYLRDIQTAEQNQTDSERRIIELKDVLTKSYNGIEESLSCLAADPEVAKVLCNRDVKSFFERSEESEEAFKNLKAEMNYLAFFLKSREKQVKYLEGMIDSLNELLENTQKDLEDIKNETFACKKEKENLHNDHEKCVQNIERFEKYLRFIHEEKQKSPTKLESKSEEEKLKQIIGEMQNNMKKQSDEVKELKAANTKLRKEIDDANSKIKELERNVELAESKELDGKAKLEALQSNLVSREKVAKNQEEMIKILQDSVNVAQKEQEELQKKLIDAEADKEKLLIKLEESEKKVGNLQEALLVTKTQLEELQGKGDSSAGSQDQLGGNRQNDELHGNKYELSIRDRIIRFLHMDLSEIQSQYNNCYGEVVKQEKALDTLRDSNDDLRVEIVSLEEDIGILEFQLAEKLKIINFTKNRVEEMERALNNRDTTIKDISDKVRFLEDENRSLKLEKNELLKAIKEQSKVKKWECKVAQLKSSFDTVVKRNTILEKEVNLLKQTLEDYRQQIDKSETQTTVSPVEVNNCMKIFKSLQERMSVLNNLLKEKSEDLTQVQAGYQVLQNELEIVKEQYNTLEASASEEERSLKLEIEDLEGRLEKYQCEYHRLVEEDQKHQKMLSEASNRETKLQNESMAREKELVGKLEMTQEKEKKLSDTVMMLDKELQNVKTELAERDAQLQAVASQNHLSVQTIEKLQSELEAKTESVRSLQNNVNDLNANLVTSMKKLEEKQTQLQELQAEITKLKCRLDFSEGYRGATCDEVCTLQREASRLKSEIRRLMMIQEKATSEVREYLSIPESWWWDDFWQI